MCKKNPLSQAKPHLRCLFSALWLTGAFTLMALSVQGVGPDSRGQKKSRQTQDALAPQIMALLQKHDDALNRHDLEGVVEIFAPGEEAVLMGTGPNELWQGVQQIKTAYSRIFRDFDEGTMTRQCIWKNGGIRGDLGWVAASCKFSDSKQGKSREYEVNITGVLEKQQGRWYFASLHVSNFGYSVK
jgi:uncharacterized protein (TIGR02246 family)